MSDTTPYVPLNQSDPVNPDKPIGVNVGDIRTTPVAAKNEPVITITAADYEAGRALVNIMEAELETIKQDAEYGADLVLADLRKRREATARRYLEDDKRLSCVAAEDREGIVQGLMLEFDLGLAEIKKNYSALLAEFREKKAAHLLKLRELLLFDGVK